MDTSVLVAGLAAFRPETGASNASALFLREWIERRTFVWLLTEEILEEYKVVMARLGVRRHLIGKLINLLREEVEMVPVSRSARISPDPGDDPFCACAEDGMADFLVTLNRKDFPQHLLRAHVIGPADAVPTSARKKRPRPAR